MKKTFLDLEIDKAWGKMAKFVASSAYDSGVRDVLLEGYIKGLEKARSLVRKQERLNQSK